jgi:diguanylate cyclase (GGDEF)-like protein/PAS domain S-box-containing protein
MADPKYRQANKSSRRVLITLVLLPLVLSFFPASEFTGTIDYLPVHSFLEIIAVVVASSVFAMGWYTYLDRADYRTVSVACLFLGVAILDFSHVLSFGGMPDFITPSGPNKAIDFWLAARSFAALALVAAVMMPETRAPAKYRYLLLTAVAAVVAGLHVLFLYFPQLTPKQYDEKTGLTAFKIGFEYVLILIYGVAAYLLWRRGVGTKRVGTLYLAIAAAIMAFSELLLTRYVNPFDAYNVTGHLYKVLAYAYLYRALVVTGIVSPHLSLTKANARLLATLDAIPDLMFEIKSDGTIVDYHSSVDETNLLAPPSVFIGRKMQEFVSAQAYEVCQRAIADIDQHGRTSGRSYWIEREDGRHFFEISGASIVEADSDPRYLLLARDITERRNADAELRIAATAFLSQESILITDTDLRILRVNAAFERDTGYTQAEVKGRTPRTLSSGEHDAKFYRQMWDAIKATGHWHGEIRNRRKNGEVYPQSLTITAVSNLAGEVTHYVGDYIDKSAIKKAEEEINKLSNFDPLTGLANRRRLLSLLEQNVARSVELNHFGALLMIDLDEFKNINNTLGHQAGDALLIEVAERLQRLVPSQGIVARYGGDEFVLMLAALGKNAAEAAHKVQEVAQAILTELEGNYHLQASQYYSSCSIGVTLFGDGSADTAELIKQMDIALFQAKSDGGNDIRFFDPAWQTAVGERALLLVELREAIRQHQFELYYQPQWDVDGVVVGAEALVRWNHPVRGVIAPLEFIPFAEKNGLILALNHEVLELGLARIKAWQQLPQCQNLKLSINLVAEQFYEDSFAKTLISRLQELAIDPRLLMFEFTESTLMDNLELAKLNMHKLNETGVQFAIDDFGTGYSSLTYLSQLPLNLLKIDQSFVRNIHLKGKDAAIVRTIINMALTLDMEVIAEGVETESQRDFLFNNGCTLYQGYLLGRPVPASQFEAERALSSKGPE